MTAPTYDELLAIVADVDRKHANDAYCQQHGMSGCDCGSGWTYRCPSCAQRDKKMPCATWRATHPKEVYP